jgi:hypothetical protein
VDAANKLLGFESLTYHRRGCRGALLPACHARAFRDAADANLGHGRNAAGNFQEIFRKRSEKVKK